MRHSDASHGGVVTPDIRLTGSVPLPALDHAALYAFLEAAPDAMLLVNARGEITYASAQALTLFGYTAAELINQNVDTLVPDSLRGAHAGYRQTYMLEPKPRAMGTGADLVGRRKDGSEIPVEISLSPMPMGDAQLVAAAVRDVSESRRVARLLRDSQEYNRGLIESNIDALMTTDLLGIITDVNAQMCEVTGRTRAELLGTPFKDCFTDPQRAEDGVRQVLAKDRVTNYELTMQAKDGRQTVVSYNAATFRDADGHLKGVFAAARDITDQKLLESQINQRNLELTETSTFLGNVLESSTEYSIIAKDLDGVILTWNEGARRNYGYSAEEMVGKGNTALLYTPEDLVNGRVRALFHQALTTGKSEGVFESVRKSGEHFTASVSMTLRHDIHGRPVGYLLISKDITEQKRMEAQLRRKNEELEEQYRRVQEANRLKSEFLANMSHELRTPLNAIIGFSELMHDGRVGAVSETHKEYLGNILTSGKHLLQLINDVLDLAKVESGKMEFHPEPVELVKIVSEVCDVLRAMLSNKHIRLSVDVARALTDIQAVPAKLKQVLYNYLSNALKFTPEGGKVHLRMKPEDADSYRIEVEDSGIGIKPEDIPRLFVEFQQLDASVAKLYQGTGLGLALTKRIVEAQGGKVGVSSVFGQGSTFYVVLPRQLRGDTEVPPALPETLAGRDGMNILIVDANAEDRAWLQTLLQREGYRTDVASDTTEHVLNRCRTHRYDAILLDVLLVEPDACTALRAICERGPNRQTPVVMVLVASEGRVGLAFTIQDHLVKPLAHEPLRQVLGHAGIAAGDGCVLVVDHDPASLASMDKSLSELGYRVCTADSAAAGLAIAHRQRPDMVILDLLMPRTEGFAVLRQFRTLQSCENVPVIIWTAGDFSRRVHEQGLLDTPAILYKDSGEGATPLLTELQKRLAPRDTLHQWRKLRLQNPRPGSVGGRAMREFTIPEVSLLSSGPLASAVNDAVRPTHG